MPPADMLAALWSRRRSLLWLLAAIAWVRLAGFLFGLANVDECDFALFGRLMGQGAVPYVDVVDNKPPLTYAFYALASLVGGTHWLLVVRILGVLAVFATALLLRAAAEVASGDARQGWAAAWLAVAAGLCDSPSVSAELLMNLPSAAALWLLARAGRERRTWLYAAAGAAAGLAPMCKQPAAILPLAIGAALAWDAAGGGAARLRQGGRWLASFLAGVGAPWVALAGALAAAGGLSAAWEWLVLRNLAQMGSGNTFSAARALGAIATCVGATLLPWALAGRGALRGRGAYHRTLVLLLLMSWIPVSSGGRFYEHYFLQFVPPLALLAAPELVRLRDRWPVLGAARRAAVLLAAILPVLGYSGYTIGRGIAGGYAGQERSVLEVAGWLARNTTQSERVFVWGDRSTVYCESGRLPGTRYLRASFHVGDLDPEHLPPGFVFKPSRPDVESTLADLEANRTAIFVDTAPADIHRWSLFPLREVPQLDAYVQEHYRLVAHPAGAAVYRRPATAEVPGAPPPVAGDRRR
jgi:hypothetical protein